MKLIKETYYAIRIGDHVPYLKLGADLETPALFRNMKKALPHLIPKSGEKIVRVEIRELK